MEEFGEVLWPRARVVDWLGCGAARSLRGLQSERTLAPHLGRSHSRRAVTVIEITAFRLGRVAPTAWP
jgi:hypothetical protein